jgi:hypothetical protein
MTKRKHRSNAENSRAQWERIERLEHERLTQGERPNLNLTSPEEARKYGWVVTGDKVIKVSENWEAL